MLASLLCKDRPASESESGGDSDSDSASAAHVAPLLAQVEEKELELEREVVEQGESDHDEEDEEVQASQESGAAFRQWCTNPDVSHEPAFRPIIAFRSWRSWFISSYAELKQGMAKSVIL